MHTFASLNFYTLSLIKSISGIRGTIGGKSGDALTPIDIAKFTLAFGTILKLKDAKKIVVGRDARFFRKQNQIFIYEMVTKPFTFV